MSRVFVWRAGTRPSGWDVVLDVESHVHTGEAFFQQHFGSITSLERDLLMIGASIFAVDRGIRRGEREDFARTLEVSIPIVNAVRLQPVTSQIEAVLRYLSNDRWRIFFRQEGGQPEEGFNTSAIDGQTLLFSGGLDSLAAALEFGRANQMQLVSHVTRNRQIREAQSQLVQLLEGSGVQLPHLQLFVSSSDAPGFDHDIESTQRTRSFLFLIVGCLAARRLGHKEILMIAENGQMAIHLPLSHARIGAFSTHTAHPEVLNGMQSILNQVLSTNLRITNPYVSKTKAEAIQIVWQQMQRAIPVAISCWRHTRLPRSATHCGECIPCIVRRIALEYHGSDPTQYARNLFSENAGRLPPEDEGRRNLAELCEFTLFFEQQSDPELMDHWPELYSPYLDPQTTMAMYRRAALETRTVLSRYAGLTPLLQ